MAPSAIEGRPTVCDCAHQDGRIWPGPPNCSAAAIVCSLGKSGRPITEHATAARDPKENSRAFTPSIALTEMNAAAWGIAASECRAPWAQMPARRPIVPPLPFSFAHSPKT